MESLDCKAILFDMDGTLIDSNEASETIWKHWTQLRGISMDQIRAVHHGRRPEETIALVAPQLNAVQEAKFIYEDQSTCRRGIHPIPGANAFYELVPAGTCGIVTAATQEILNLRFEIVGLKPPPICVTAEKLKNGKPDPEGYLKCAAQLGIPAKDCVVFEDAPAGLIAAKRAGMRSVAVLTHYSVAQLKLELGIDYEPSCTIRDYLGMNLQILERGELRIRFKS